MGGGAAAENGSVQPKFLLISMLHCPDSPLPAETNNP
jgi:hypothetical protein